MAQWRVEPHSLRQEQVRKVGAGHLGRSSVTIHGEPGSGRSAFVRDVAAQLGPDAVVVQVPKGMDAVEATILRLADHVSAEHRADVSAQLERSQGSLAGTLATLQAGLGSRKLCVDDYDLVGRSTFEDAELWSVYRGATRELALWLEKWSVLRTRVDGLPGSRLLEPLHGSRPPYSLRTANRATSPRSGTGRSRTRRGSDWR